MKYIALLSLLASFHLFSATLEFKKDSGSFKSVTLSEMKTGKVFNINSQEVSLYNIWRKDTKTYEGYAFYELLNYVYGKSWKDAKFITFKALDGYTVGTEVKAMLEASSGRAGFVSYKEKGKKGFTMAKKGKKVIDPGPFYLVWSNFKEGDKAAHVDALKWPYQLKEVDIKFK